MHGNVWEWIHDYWADRYATTEMETNPTGPETGSVRVMRGGGWYNTARDCRSAVRNWYHPGVRDISLGFRLARTIP